MDSPGAEGCHHRDCLTQDVNVWKPSVDVWMKEHVERTYPGSWKNKRSYTVAVVDVIMWAVFG